MKLWKRMLWKLAPTKLTAFLLCFILLSFGTVYTYKAIITSVHDGDTITADIDVGFGITITKTLRLKGIDAPETYGSEEQKGEKVRDSLKKWILNKEVEVITYGQGSFGRTIAVVIHKGDTINRKLVKKGFAEESDY